MSKSWKETLLKSGLPFEYEVKEHFVKNGCYVEDEYKYQRFDENNIEKEFSFDIDATYWNGCSIDFMIECKYKTKETGWFFLPDPYAYQQDIIPDDFFYIGDYFIHEQFRFSRDTVKKEFLSPLCLKGVEILDSDFNESTIRRAISQVSYAFIEKFIDGINEQLFTEMFYDTAFIKIPLIITNANLYRIKEGTTVEEIKNAQNIKDISDQLDFVIHRNKVGFDLKNYNKTKLSNYFSSIDKSYALKNLHYYNKNLESFIEDASEYPELILIMHQSQEKDNYKKLFNYVDQIIKEKHPDAIKRRNPPPDYIAEVNRQLNEILEKRNKKTTPNKL